MSFLIFGGVIFWVFIGVITFVLICTVESFDKNNKISKGELGWPITILLTATTLCVISNNPSQLFHSFQESIIRFILFFIGYIFIGVLWSFVRWVMVVKSAHKRYLSNKGNTGRIYDVNNFIPKLSEWKASISSWIIFWPFSVLRYIFGSAFIDLMDAITSRLSGIYENITKNIFGQEIIVKDDDK